MRIRRLDSVDEIKTYHLKLSFSFEGHFPHGATELVIDTT